jgi:hypothetical protein
MLIPSPMHTGPFSFGIEDGFFLAAVICSGLFVALCREEATELNRVLPRDQQFSQTWLSLKEPKRLAFEYKRVFPSGRIDAWRVGLEWAAVALWTLALFSIGAVALLR